MSTKESKASFIMIIGSICFEAEHGHGDSTVVNSVDAILFVDEDKIDEVGEEYLKNGYDAYLCPVLHTYPITSSNPWYVLDGNLCPVMIDSQMCNIVGFETIESMLKEHPNVMKVTDDNPNFWEDYDNAQWTVYDNA